MDAIGLRAQIAQMADRIADWGTSCWRPTSSGVMALWPTFPRRGDLTVPEERDAFFATGVMDRVGSMTPDVIDTDADVWLSVLLSVDAVSDGPIATTGYCFGGRLALRTAAHRPGDVAVVGMFHTGGIVIDGPDSPHLVVPQVKARVLAGQADADRSNTPEQIAAFDEALAVAGVPHRSAVYPDAAHGYTMADTSSYQEAGAERHFAELREALAVGLGDWARPARPNRRCWDTTSVTRAAVSSSAATRSCMP